jgi:septal ring factor EnvC (AmiA/AmiB activator)
MCGERGTFLETLFFNHLQDVSEILIGQCRSDMEREEELDQFQLLEEKLDALINYISSLKTEKDSLSERLQIQEEKINNLTGELEQLRSARDNARRRIVSLLEKIEKLEV